MNQPHGARPATAISSASAAPAAFATLANVSKRYGGTVALNNLSLALRPGEVLALLGPNGAGKSTAVRLLLGLITPTSGQATVFGHDPKSAAAHARIGAMLQVARLPETLKVREHLDLFRSYYSAPLPAAEVVRIAHLDGLEDRMFSQLSGGQKQRVLFGLALCGDPDLIFLDEPTTGMDIEARRALWDQVRLLAARGKTILLTTHYLEEADALAHRIVVLNKGSIVAEGTPTEIKSRSTGRKIRCHTTLPEQVLRSLPGVLTLENNRGDVLITTAQAEPIARLLLAADPDLCNLEITSPALEDAFMELTRDAPAQETAGR